MFYRWLVTQAMRQDAVGALARNAKQDPFYPRQVVQLASLLRYYDADPRSRRMAAPELRQAMKKAHAEWRKVRYQKVAS